MTSLLRALAAPALSGEVLGPGRVVDKYPVPVVGRTSTFSDSLGRYSDGGDKEAQSGAMGANGTLYAIVGGIAFDVSAVQWKLWQKAPSGKPEDRTEVTSHPSIELFDQPNPFMPWQEFSEVVQQHMELTGEGWSLTSFMGRVPMELWPVYPHRMTPIPHPTDFLSGYVYASPDGQKITLSTQECTMLRQPHPLTLFRGLSAVQAIGSDLSAGMAASRWNDRFFTNSAIPGGVIEQDLEAGALTDDEYKTFVQRWREQHQGSGNAHRVAVLEAGMKWVSNQYSLKDLQFVELREMSRDIVREAFRYPISKLGTVTDVNRANGQEQERRYARDILVPRLMRWKAWRNREIMPLFGADWRRYEWDFENPEPEDTETEAALLTARSTAWKVFVDGGVDGSAAIKELDLPEGLAKAWTKPEPPPVVAPGGAGGAGKPPAKKAPPKSSALPIEWGATWAKADDAEPDDWTGAIDDTVERWQAEVSPAQRDAAESAVTDAITAGDLAVLASLAVPVLGADLLLEAMTAQAQEGAAAVVAEARADGVDIDAGAVARWRGRPTASVLAVLREVAEVTAAMLASGLAAAAGKEALRLVSRGRTAAEIAEDVRAHLEALSARSLTDAIGAALTRARNAGRLATFRVVAVAPPFGWRYELVADETLDKNTCVRCREVDGTVLPTLDAAQLAYGGAGYLYCEGTVRCRGTVRARWTRDTGSDDGA